VVLAVTDGELIALLIGHDQVSARLERIYVLDGKQGRGVGGKLLRRALQRAGSLGYRRVVLDVIAERAAAIRLYERLGFEPITPYTDYGRPMVFLGRDL
jgi:putative acetyltransferase